MTTTRPRPTTTTTEATTTTVEPFPADRLTHAEPGTPEADVEAAWRQALDGYRAAVFDPPNPEHPDFVRWYADPALSEIQAP